MVKSRNLNDKEKYKIVRQELSEFNELTKGHRKLLVAIGNL